MCLSVPGKVVSVEGSVATVDMMGVSMDVDVSLLEEVKEGDWVLVHVGFAIQRLDPKAAAEKIEAFGEMNATRDAERGR